MFHKHTKYCRIPRNAKYTISMALNSYCAAAPPLRRVPVQVLAQAGFRQASASLMLILDPEKASVAVQDSRLQLQLQAVVSASCRETQRTYSPTLRKWAGWMERMTLEVCLVVEAPSAEERGRLVDQQDLVVVVRIVLGNPFQKPLLLRDQSRSLSRSTLPIVRFNLGNTANRYFRLFHGAKKKFKVKRKTFDRDGRIQREDKDLEITVKPGMKAGSKFKFKGVGDEIEGTKQDIHFVVAEKPHHLFERKGDDLIATISIPLKEALTGWSKQIKTIDGKNLKVSHSGPTSPTWTEIYPALGMILPKDPSQRGNLIVKVDVRFFLFQ
jgi:hypothetical protein